jgi:hypothetical protein
MKWHGALLGQELIDPRRIPDPYQILDRGRGRVRNIYRKVKKNLHKSLSPASVDNLVHKSLRPSISCHFLG